MDIYKKNGKSGMTLIEILIVVALLGILAGVMVKSLGSSLDQGKKGAADTFVTDTLPSAIQLYKVRNNGKSPESLDTLIEEGVISGKNDPWGNEYGYKKEAGGVEKYVAVWCNYNADKAAATIAGTGDGTGVQDFSGNFKTVIAAAAKNNTAEGRAAVYMVTK